MTGAHASLVRDGAQVGENLLGLDIRRYTIAPRSVSIDLNALHHRRMPTNSVDMHYSDYNRVSKLGSRGGFDEAG